MTKYSRNATQTSWFGSFVARLATITTLVLFVAIGVGAANAAQVKDNDRKSQQEMDGKARIPAAPTAVNFGSGMSGNAQRASAPLDPSVYDQERLLAAHLVRRAGFGPTFKDLKKLSKNPEARLKWINDQLNPAGVSDSALKLPNIDPDNYDYDYLRSWFTRMVFSKRQLQEKMTLIWHEHFSVSLDKVAEPLYMSQHEARLRKFSLGNFRDFLVDMTPDNAMLRWLDNDYNYAGNPINDPPNENYAREFMQLYTLGTVLMSIDGTPIHADGTPLGVGESAVQPYSENLDVNNQPCSGGAGCFNDVQMLARSLAGWHIDYCNKYPDCSPNGIQDNGLHNSAAKTLHMAGLTINIPSGMDAKTELIFVVDQILNGNPIRRDSAAAFMAKVLIGKLATENPSPAYIQAVAVEFRDSGWQIKEAVREILTNPEFENAANVRTMFKEPIEQYVGSIRALFGKTDGDGGLIDWANDTGHLIWWPPSVFSFYPPGQRAALVNTMFVFERDDSSGDFVVGETTAINMKTLMKKGKLTKTYGEVQADLVGPTVDYLADLLLGAELEPNVRTTVVDYMLNNNNPGNGQDYVDDGFFDRDIRYAAWLILCSPDFARN